MSTCTISFLVAVFVFCVDLKSITRDNVYAPMTWMMRLNIYLVVLHENKLAALGKGRIFTIMDLGLVFAAAYRARSEVEAIGIMVALSPAATPSQVVTCAKTLYPALFRDLEERAPEVLLLEIGCVLYMKEPHDPMMNLEWLKASKKQKK